MAEKRKSAGACPHCGNTVWEHKWISRTYHHNDVGKPHDHYVKCTKCDTTYPTSDSTNEIEFGRGPVDLVTFEKIPAATEDKKPPA